MQASGQGGQDQIRQFVVGRLETNCYVYVSEGSCIVVDPGAAGAEIAHELEGLEVALVVATHRHHDHVGGVRALVEACGSPWAIGAGDARLVTLALELSSHGFALSSDLADPPEPDRLLHEGDVLRVGTASFTVIDTPGHTEGGISLLGGGSAEGVCFVGDTLFAGSCGRTDLLGGDHETLMASLTRLTELVPPETALLCGHGPHTTMAMELATNPWLQGGERLSDGMH